jgi:hypothetical protein
LQRDRAVALGWAPTRRRTYWLDVYLQILDDTTQRITVYTKISGSSKLITLLPLQDRQDEALLELTHRLKVPDATLVHMQHEIFELNFHDEFPFLHSAVVGLAISGKLREKPVFAT